MHSSDPRGEVIQHSKRQNIGVEASDLDERRDSPGQQGDGSSGTAKILYARLLFFVPAPLKGFTFREVAMNVSTKR